MLGQGYPVEAFVDCCLDDLFQCVLGVRTELAGVTVVCEWHLQKGRRRLGSEEVEKRRGSMAWERARVREMFRLEALEERREDGPNKREAA